MTNATINTTISARIDSIIAERKALLPKVDSALEQNSARVAALSELNAGLNELQHLCTPNERHELTASKEQLANILALLSDQEDSLRTVRARFDRDYVTHAVSGYARMGKSTTLQKFSGLNDKQLPTGPNLPVTAVKSRLINDSQAFALVTFRTEGQFMRDYVQPHLSLINKELEKAKDRTMSISSLEDFRSFQFPKGLGDVKSAYAADALKRLRQAQASLPCYASLLTGSTKRIDDLDELKPFVSYPSEAAQAAERNEGKVPARKFLAVADVEIHCPFPNMADAKLCLVDLPGLGEVDGTVAEKHLEGLRDNVDAVLVISSPQNTDAFADDRVVRNVEQLQNLHSAMKRPGDFISLGVNVRPGFKEQADIHASELGDCLNSGLKHDRYDVWEYDAKSDSSTAMIFSHWVEKTAERLPRMDADLLQGALRANDVDAAFRSAMAGTKAVAERILMDIPTESGMAFEDARAIGKQVIDGLKRLEAECAVKSAEESEMHRQLMADVAMVHGEVADAIEHGLFCGKKAWENRAKGQVDYVVFYREEAQRLRREIISRYRKLDDFYTVNVDGFKKRVLDTFLAPMGQLEDALVEGAQDSQADRALALGQGIYAATGELAPLSAMEELARFSFDFRNDAFRDVSCHLEHLLNPDARVWTGDFYRGEPVWGEDKAKEIGGVGDVDFQIRKTREYLQADAIRANDALLKAFENSEDRFGSQIADCMSFFNDDLFRSDSERFTYVVIGGLVEKHRDAVLPPSPEAKRNAEKAAAAQALLDTLAEAR